MDLAVPGADRRLQIVDVVIEIDLRLDPVGHLRKQVLDAHVALERRAHFNDVEIDGAGRDRLLQTRVVVGLGKIDPFDIRAGVGLPRLEEAAEQEIVQVLVVEPHEGEVDPLEFAGLNVRLGRSETKFADLLPVGVGRRSIAGSRNFHDLGDDAVRRVGGPRRKGQRAACGECGHRACGPLDHLAPTGLHRHKLFVDSYAHSRPSRSRSVA